MIEFRNINNYRGSLQVKEECIDDDCKYYWRVSCDVHYESWHEITFNFYLALINFHKETSGSGSSF